MALGMADPVGGDALKLAGTALQTEAFARRYYALFNERRLDEAERLVDPQAVFSYPGAREHLIGRAGYRELVRRWLDALADAHISITGITVLDGVAAQADWIAEGTHEGVLELPGFPPIPASGRPARLPMRETIRVRNGLIVDSRMDFDPRELQRVLGL